MQKRNQMLYVRLAVWHFAKLHVLVNVTHKKITEHVCAKV